MSLAFDLEHPPRSDIHKGRYHLISKSDPKAGTGVDAHGRETQSVFLYRLSHPLGEHVVGTARALSTPPVGIIFDVTNHPTRLRVIEALRGKTGYLTLTRLSIDSYEREELPALLRLRRDRIDARPGDDGENCSAVRVDSPPDSHSDGTLPAVVMQRLHAESQRHARATLRPLVGAEQQAL